MPSFENWSGSLESFMGPTLSTSLHSVLTLQSDVFWNRSIRMWRTRMGPSKCCTCMYFVGIGSTTLNGSVCGDVVCCT